MSCSINLTLYFVFHQSDNEYHPVRYKLHVSLATIALAMHCIIDIDRKQLYLYFLYLPHEHLLTFIYYVILLVLWRVLGIETDSWHCSYKFHFEQIELSQMYVHTYNLRLICLT